MTGGGGDRDEDDPGERLARSSPEKRYGEQLPAVCDPSHHLAGTAQAQNKASKGDGLRVQPNEADGLEGKVTRPTSPCTPSPTSPRTPFPTSRPDCIHGSPSPVPSEREVVKHSNPNPRFEHIWRRSEEAGVYEIVLVPVERRDKPRNPSLGEGDLGWSTLGGDKRSFVEVVRASSNNLRMYGRERYGAPRRAGFGAGRQGRGAGRTEARAGYNHRERPYGRGRAGWRDNTENKDWNH